MLPKYHPLRPSVAEEQHHSKQGVYDWDFKRRLSAIQSECCVIIPSLRQHHAFPLNSKRPFRRSKFSLNWVT
jgi:hypothetical protein